MVHKRLDSNDHYVSQTYLRKFECFENFVFVYPKKRDRLEKPLPISSICHEEGGDIIQYFDNRFGLREILHNLERSWNPFIEAVIKEDIINISKNHPKQDDLPLLYRVSMYISYLRCLSPTNINLSIEQHEYFAKQGALISLAHAMDPELIKAYESLKEGSIKIVSTNRQYHKCQNMQILVPLAHEIYNRNWTVLINQSNTKFITSNIPVVLLTSDPRYSYSRFVPIYLPLTPEYALRIDPINAREVHYEKVSSKMVQYLNREVAKWADDVIISSSASRDDRLSNLVKKYRSYKVITEYKDFAVPDGLITVFRHVAGKAPID